MEKRGDSSIIIISANLNPMNQSATKITAILGALILLAGAGFHLTGLMPVKGAVADVEPEFYKHALIGMWVMPAVHWIFIACLSVGLSRYRSKACAAILMAFGVWVLVDAVITFLHVGAFMGVYMLGLAGGLLVASGVMLKRDMRAG